MTIRRLLPFGSLFLLIFFYMSNTAQGAAVMSVDLGNEWMKVSVVSPGVPMEIALNKESKRKTPAILAYRDGERTFGEDAQSTGVRFPPNAYFYLLDLLGKTVDNPLVGLYKKRFPYYEIVGDEKRNTVVFKNGDMKFSVEELISQMLLKAKEFAQDYTGQQITECVLIVPGFFGQAERLALLASAQLANLKVLQLINDYTAVALNYGVFRRTEINETAQYYLFYDMGAQKTEATVVSYQLVRDKATKETNPVVQILGVGFDRTLGGLDIQLRLRDHLAKEFNKLKKTKTNVLKNPRAMAKLFKEAGRVKNVLSANNDHYAQIENLIEDHDFKVQVTREQLEEMCKDIWPRIVKPLQQALTTAGLSLDVMNQVILFGGGTRVPKVQEILRDYIKQDLGKNLNADEAASMGAVYKAADLATGFKVKKIIVKDAVVFPIQIEFERDPGDGNPVKQFKRKLFGLMNPYPQKKFIAFNKHVNDFDFYVNYADLNLLNAEEIAYLGSLNISHIQLKKVNEILEKNKGENVESKGIKAHFTMDDSGILSMTGVDFIFEKQKVGGDDDGDESTLSKLGSTISKLFSSDSGKNDADAGDEKKTDENTTGDSVNKATEENADGKKNETVEKKGQNETAKTEEKESTKNDTVKIVIIKEPVENEINYLFATPLTGEAYEESLKKVNDLNQADMIRQRREHAFNALESFVIEAQERLANNEYADCATDDEKKKILDECTAVSDWLYEGGQQAEAHEIEKRLYDLEQMTNEIYARHWEHQERPEALKALKGMIDNAKKFLLNVKNLTKESNPEKDILTSVELDTLQRVIDETITWQSTETEAQKQLKRYETVRLTVKDISDKMGLLDREIKYLVNKIKIWKPKKPAAKKEASTGKKNKTTTEEGEGGGGDKNETVTIDEQVEKAPEEKPNDGKVEQEKPEVPTTTGSENVVKKEKKSKKNEREPETQTPHGEL